MDANFADVYKAVIVDGTTVSNDRCDILQDVNTLQTVVQCCTVTDDDRHAVVELCFDRFEDAYIMWTALGDADTRLLVTVDDEE